MNKIKRKIQQVDFLADKPHERYHFDGNEKHKSYVGGICSIILIFSVFTIIIVLAIPIFYKDLPYSQVTDERLGEEEEIFYHKAYKILIEIEDYNQYFDIDPTMIDVYVNHYFQDTNKETNEFNETITRYEVRRCTQDDFNGTEFESNLFNYQSQKQKYHCINNPHKNLSTMGTLKSRIKKENKYSFFKLFVHRCTNQTGENTGRITQQCKDDEVIDNWTKDKYLKIHILNWKKNLDPNGQEYIYQDLIEMAHIPIDQYSVSKGTCLFRKNILSIKDSIFGNFKSEKIEFTEYQFQKQDQFFKNNFNYSDPMQLDYKYRIAEMKFSNSVVLIKSQLKVITFLDLLSSISGIPNFLYVFFGFWIARFQRFYSNFQMYKSFDHKHPYEMSGQNTNHSQIIPSENKIEDIGVRAQLKMYLFSQSRIISKICCCFLKGGSKIQSQIDKIQKVGDVLRHQFDMRKMLISFARILRNQQIILKKLKMTSQMPANIINEWLTQHDEDLHSQELLLKKGKSKHTTKNSLEFQLSEDFMVDHQSTC